MCKQNSYYCITFNTCMYTHTYIVQNVNMYGKSNHVCLFAYTFDIYTYIYMYIQCWGSYTGKVTSSVLVILVTFIPCNLVTVIVTFYKVTITLVTIVTLKYSVSKF